jgi:PAS domain S-box-containing protein
VDLQFVPFQDSGQVNGFIILGYDITDLKKAEWALKETQMRLEFALENANMTSWYLDLKTNQVLSTPGSKPLSGYEVERQSLYDMTCAKVHPDDVDHTFKALSESIQEHKPYQHEYRQLQSDGSYRWILSRAMPQYDEGGLPVSISGVMVDITERRQTEDLYRAVTEMTPQFVWIGDAKGAITYSNSTLGGDTTPRRSRAYNRGLETIYIIGPTLRSGVSCPLKKWELWLVFEPCSAYAGQAGRPN